MATYVNNLRLKEIATGAESGTWGTSTNTNLELIADALGSGTEAITTNADTHTTTIADGTADEGRALFLKYTGTLDSACTITLAPNTVNKMWFIENATSGSQNIIISQGSGANITIASGKIAVVYTDGAGSGAAVLDALADLELSSTLSVAGATTLTGAATLSSTLVVAGATTISSTLAVTGGVATFGDDVVSDTDSTDDLGTTGVRWANLWVDDVVATTTVKPGTLVLAAGSITDTSGAITFGNENLVTTGTFGAAATTLSSTLTVAGILSVDNTTQTSSGTTGSIHTDGGLGVAKDLFVSGNISLAATSGVYFDGGAHTLIKENSPNVLRCVAGGSGGVDLTSGATSWTSVSDERAKILEEPIIDAMAKLGTLRTVFGTFRDDHQKIRHPLLIAQDVLAVYPEAVVLPEGEDTYRLSYTDMIPLMISGMNETGAALSNAQARIETLEARLEAAGI